MNWSKSAWAVATWGTLAAFGAYFSMYAFRKPFAAATFEGLQVLGMDYKALLVVSQLLGYLLSKFIGIKVISELRPENRIKMLVLLLAIAELALVGFAVVPPAYGALFLFINGIPLGMVFGVVFSFIEGRRYTEVMSLGLGISIIFASGAVKSVGKTLIDHWQVNPWWMPALTGLVFVPLLALSTVMLLRLPPPTPEDTLARSPRLPMTGQARRALFHKYALGIVWLVLAYILLTILRDIRDNFAVEIWRDMGFAKPSALLLQSELWVSLLILLFIGSLSRITDNALAFTCTQWAVLVGGAVLGLSTWLFDQHLLGAMPWVVVSGFGLFMGYTVFQGIIFERMLAHFKETGNVGFLMYLADSFGYLGSAAVIVWKNLGQTAQINLLSVFKSGCYYIAVFTVALSALSLLYFQKIKNSHEQL